MADDNVRVANTGFLVKGAESLVGGQSFAALRGKQVPLAPLNPEPPSLAKDKAVATDADRWGLATVNPYEAIEGVNRWELAHELARAFLRDREDADILVEPDLRQTPPVWEPPKSDPAAKSAEAWHLGQDFSDLADARKFVSDAAQAKVIVAHLDTGYDPGHELTPRNIRSEWERNFEDRDASLRHSAIEPAHGDLLRYGHGAGTLGILAGGVSRSVFTAGTQEQVALGGAPSVTVVPIRIADFAARFWSSSIAAGLNHARAIGAHVVSLSFGGLPSAAWADAVNACYEAGVVVVAAAGNNFSGFPVRDIVWPARFRRVVSVCGIMKNQQPYIDLGGVMEGNFGPPGAMDTAMAAYTPGIPWALAGSGDQVDPNGAGTAAAASQVAAAAALWIAGNYAQWSLIPEGWQRVEAVRTALFDTAWRQDGSRTYIGRGILSAEDAAKFPFPDVSRLKMEERDTASFAFLRVLAGMGAGGGSREAMYRTEATQVATLSAALRQLVPDMDTAAVDARKFAGTLLDNEIISKDLRQWLSGLAGRRSVPGGTLSVRDGNLQMAQPASVSPAKTPPRHLIPARDVPVVRRLRVFATDPMQALDLRRFDLATATITVPWDAALKPGPVGEYIEVVDVDPQNGRFYRPVDLSDGNLVAQDGLLPSLEDPRFHQQMTYAVAMRVVDRFERVLGRSVLWQIEPDYWRNAPKRAAGDETAYVPMAEQVRQKEKLEELTFVQREYFERGFVRRLRIYPHAMRGRNAFYSPKKVALLFGYFRGLRPLPKTMPPQPGDMVFTCLSFDIIAHETTHAVLDAINRRLREATNPDVLAFHEALADIVALFERFSLMDLLRREISEAKGRLGATRLGELAREFGNAMGYGRALRDAIGQDPTTYNYMTADEVHDRGAVLVAAVFDAFLSIYERRTSRLTSLLPLPQGNRPIHPIAVELLANEARKAAEHVLTMCLRALDYMPPVDIRFSDFLRALITADMEVEAQDEYGYRVAFIEAFSRRYIFAEGVRATSVDSLRWRAPDEQIEGFSSMIRSLDLRWDRSADRLDVYASSRLAALKLHDWIEKLDPEKARMLGVELLDGEKFEVSSVRTLQRVTPAGRIHKDIVIVITQTRMISNAAGDGTIPFRSGSTIIVSADDTGRDPIRYFVSKSPVSEMRREQARAYLAAVADGQALYFDKSGEGKDNEPFAFLHKHG